MADETVSIQLLIDTSKSATNMAELEESIEAMREELRKTEIGSQEFDKLARSIQQAENKVKDIELTYESADLEGRFGRLGDVIGGVARGAAAVEGALFLMGEEGEEAEEVMAKLMSAMAIADSIEGFAKLGSALQKFTSITAIAEKAQLALGVAIRASNRKEFIGSIRDMGKSLLGMSKSTNLAAIAKTALAAAIKAVRIAFTVLLGPIGWVIAGVTALGAVVYKFREQIESVVRAIPGLSDALEWLGLISSEQELAAQKAVDAAKKEIDAINEKVKAIEEARDQELEAIDDTIREIDRELKVRSAAGEDVSKLERQRIEEILKRVRVEKEAMEQIVALRKQEIAQLEALDSNFYKKGAEALKKKNDEREKELKEYNQKEKDAQADLTAFEAKQQKERNDAWRKQQEEKRKQQEAEEKEAERKRLEQQKKDEQELARLKKQNADFLSETTKAVKQQADNYKNIQTNTNELYDWLYSKSSEGLKKKAEDEAAAQQQQIEIIKSGFQAIIELTDAFAGDSEAAQRKAFNIKKAASIALATIETIQAAQSAYASQMAIPTPDAPIRAAIAAGIAVASGLARVAAIAKTKFESTGTTATGGGGGGRGLQGPNSPGQANMLPVTGETVLRGNQMDTKVVVVESDITNVQSRVNVIENQAKVR